MKGFPFGGRFLAPDDAPGSENTTREL